MAQFLNQEANPQEKDSAKSKTVSPVPEKLDWNSATDMGVNALERAAIQASGKTPAVTAGESFTAGMGNSIIAAAIRKASAPNFETDYNWDARKVMQQDQSMRLLAPNQDEIDYLHDSVSQDDYQYRTQQMLEQRQRDQDVSKNIVSGIAGSIIGDAPIMLAPMGAAGVAGRAGLAVRTAIRAVDVGSAVYASDQLGQSEGVAALVAGISGVDQLWDMAKVAKAAGRAESAASKTSRFDPDAPTKRTAKDTVYARTAASEEVAAKPLVEPIQVLKGQQSKVVVRAKDVTEHLMKSMYLDEGQKAILKTLDGLVDDVPVHLTGDTNLRSAYYRMPEQGTDYVAMRASKAAQGKTWSTVGDALNSLDQNTAKIAVHELVHAATVRAMNSTVPEAVAARETLQKLGQELLGRADLPKNLRYFAGSPEEMLAGLADSKQWVDYLNSVQVGDKTLLRRIGETVLRALGYKGNDTALAKVLDSYESVLKVAADDAQAVRFKSDAMSSFGENIAATAAGDQKLLDRVKTGFRTNFALYDNIAQGNKDLANLLVSDGAAVGARKPSVADFKRNLMLEMDASASVVEDAITSALKQQQGVGMLDRFFHRSKFITARRDLEQRVGAYLDDAYSAEVAGRAVPVPPEDIAPVVKAYKDSGWAGKWYDHMQASGLVDDATIVRSDYYFPRQYSYDKMRQALREGRTLDNYRDLFRQALRDIYPTMESEVVQRVAKEITDGIYNGRAGAAGPMWKQLINGMGNDELVMAMRQAGIDEADIQGFLTTNVKPSGATSPSRNLKQRNRFNMSKEYIVDGQPMRLQDLLDTDVAKVMHGYTNRMSGRVGMSYAGIEDLKQLETMINEGKHTLADPGKWEQAVNDTIDFMLGGVAGGAGAQLPEIFRAAGNLANATMLKNSALYQITDTALAMKEFGMARVLRSMREQPWFKEGAVVFKDRDMAGRLDSILRGSLQKEMRFRWLNTYADDNLDLTRSSNWFNVTQNVGQAARHVNGMSMVHRAQVNWNSGIVMDELQSMLNGSADAVKRLERWGLDKDLAKQMQAAYAKNPGKMLPPDLQMQMEVVGSRLMDYVVQQVRTGETSHFAQFSPVGKVVVGYQSFAMAATNKILRREMNDAGWIGLAHIAAYQFPMMLLMTQAKYALDGKAGEQSDKKLITDAVMGMSVLGGLTMIQDVFGDQSPRHSLAGMGYIMGMLGLMQDVASGNVDAKGLSKQMPLIQEFAPTRAIINNFGDD